MSLGILLAEGRTLVRQALKALLEQAGFRIVGEAATLGDVGRMTRDLIPDVVIVNFGPRVLDAARAVLKSGSNARPLCLASKAREGDVLEALRAGIRGYVLETQTLADLSQAILDVSRGALYLGPGISSLVVDAYLGRIETPLEPLTLREREVLRLVAEGQTTKQVAQSLGMSVKTADCHRTRVMRKLNLHETAGLVRYAIRKGFVEA